MPTANDVIFVPLDGLSDEAETGGNYLGEDTVNFYPDNEGYLVNYPGRRDYFVRVDATGLGTPPALGTYTRLKIFRDSVGQIHIVYCASNSLFVVEGNSSRKLYDFLGKRIDGQSYPHMFTHNDRLIICNAGDPVLTWNGFEEVIPLGVTEIPVMPEVISHEDMTYAHIANNALIMWVTSGADGLWSNLQLWFPGIDLQSGIANDKDPSSNPIPGFFRWRLVFKDRDGNRSTPSPPSAIIFVKHNRTSTRAGASEDIKYWGLVEWVPPQHDWHIDAVEVYRTKNLHPDLGNSDSIYFLENTQFDPVQHRFTSGRISDTALASSTTLDTNILPPPTSDLGVSWGPRIVLRDYNNRERWWCSDEALTGQFRISQTSKARDKIEAFVPMGDRLMIVTNSTSEIYYYDNTGLVRLLEIHENKGSFYGRSFATSGNIAFGMFDDGFFMFDGQNFKEIKTPYFIKSLYLDRYHQLQRGVILGEWYFLATRKDMKTTKNNILIMLHIPTQRWFTVDEIVNDIDVYNDYILGVDDSIYLLFRGNTYPVSRLHLRGAIPEGRGILNQRTLSEVALLLNPESHANVSIEVSGEDEWVRISGDGKTYPYSDSINRDQAPYPFFDRPNTNWSSNFPWVSPNDSLIWNVLKNTQAGFRHNIQLTFQVGKPQRIKGIAMKFSDGEGVADKT